MLKYPRDAVWEILPFYLQTIAIAKFTTNGVYVWLFAFILLSYWALGAPGRNCNIFTSFLVISRLGRELASSSRIAWIISSFMFRSVAARVNLNISHRNQVIDGSFLACSADLKIHHCSFNFKLCRMQNLLNHKTGHEQWPNKFSIRGVFLSWIFALHKLSTLHVSQQTTWIIWYCWLERPKEYTKCRGTGTAKRMSSNLSLRLSIMPRGTFHSTPPNFFPIT